MKHLVTKLFTDKESGELFISGSYFVSKDYTRIQHLSSLGFIAPNDNARQLNKQEEVKPKPKPKSHTKKAVAKDVTES